MAVIKKMKMTIGPKQKQKAQPKAYANPRIGFTTPYCSHHHRNPIEAQECARRTRIKISKMRGGI